MNKYNKWYNQIIDRAKGRVLKPPFERHHIKPRSLGGTDDRENIAFITPREHFICHWLLIKMTTGEDHYKMLNALRMMRAENPGQKRYQTKITSRVYESIKLEYARLQSDRIRGEKNPMWGKQSIQKGKNHFLLSHKKRRRGSYRLVQASNKTIKNTQCLCVSVIF